MDSVGGRNGIGVNALTKAGSAIVSSSGGGRTLFRGGRAGLGDSGGASFPTPTRAKLKFN